MQIKSNSFINGVAIGSIAALAMVFGSSEQAYAVAMTFSEDFNTTTAGLSLTGVLDSKFTVTAGNVDIIPNGGLYDFYPGNGRYLDLNGTGSNSSGTITSSPFVFTPGSSATLSFNYGQNIKGYNYSLDSIGPRATVTLGGATITTLATPPIANPLTAPQPPLQFYSTSISGAQLRNGALSFVSNNPGDGGIILDNITLTYDTPAVPEPADFVGTAIAFGSVVMLKRNFGKKAK
jgi:hypothetical protein